ncbi:MAG: DUF4294 domain-containing protein [Paraprevotella sp.]|nr:DUF4294 domain-containing protein [Paraprevotella sp.]MBQ8282100.1 DUF4294 domain-containing protein [Paraprevotella sp.]
MKIIKLIVLFVCSLLFLESKAQDISETLSEEEHIKVIFHKKTQKEYYDGDSITVIIIPELPVYPPLKFKNKKEYIRFNRLVYNVKKTLPIAKTVNKTIQETYEYLETLPTKKEKDAHIKAVEKGVKKQYTPQMKKLTYSQGKLLIKLVDRECNQNSYEIVKAFLGPFKAGFYQTFAALFGASLKKEYDAEADDKMTERVVRMIEAGIL